MAAVRLKFNLAFFDQKRVIAAVGRANAKVLNEYGRRVRATAQRSLKYEDGPSQPGQPPHAHRTRKKKFTSKKTGKTSLRAVSFLREFLFYKYDFTTKSVVIGPERLNSTIDPDALPALEYGGTARVRARPRRGQAPAKVRASIKARPFMRPADAAHRGDLPALWKNSVRP